MREQFDHQRDQIRVVPQVVKESPGSGGESHLALVTNVAAVFLGMHTNIAFSDLRCGKVEVTDFFFNRRDEESITYGGKLASEAHKSNLSATEFSDVSPARTVVVWTECGFWGQRRFIFLTCHKENRRLTSDFFQGTIRPRLNVGLPNLSLQHFINLLRLRYRGFAHKLKEATMANEAVLADQALVEGKFESLELPNLDDVEHPVLRRALERVQELLKDDSAQSSYNKHHNRHDRSGSAYW